MSNWNFLNNRRIAANNKLGIHPRYGSEPSDGFNGMFVFWIDNVHVRCLASDGMGWKHVSVSLVGDRRCPKWDTMCAIKDLFWEDEDWVIQFHPAKSEYVNHHPGCLHLWQPDAPFPVPDSIMVGPKSPASGK